MGDVSLRVVELAVGGLGVFRRRTELRVSYELSNDSGEAVYVYNRLPDGRPARQATDRRSLQRARVGLEAPDTAVLMVGHQPRRASEADSEVQPGYYAPALPMATQVEPAGRFRAKLRAQVPLTEEPSIPRPGHQPRRVAVERLRVIVEYTYARDVHFAHRQRYHGNCWDVSSARYQTVEAYRDVAAQRLMLVYQPEMFLLG
jgi:hypothetical protein